MSHKLEAIGQKIIQDSKGLDELLAVWRFKGYKVVFTNGCFDILHKGHVEYLASAASLGDVLIVGLNTDISVQNIKGPERPVQDEHARGVLLAGLQFVDAVTYFGEDTPYDLIQKVQPDVLVKGADYSKENIVGWDIVEAKGGKVETIELREGYSTSNIIERIKKL